jgi:hypothetical protein
VSEAPTVDSTSSKSVRSALQNLWDDRQGAALEATPLELLRYRSNLLGADLRITNFGGGNTSSKFDLPDPLTGQPRRVMAVKGSGGDLRSIGTTGFALLYMDKLNDLIARYRGEAHEDEMVGFYPRRSTRRCTRFCRFLTSITCIRTGRLRWRPAPTANRSSTSSIRRTGDRSRGCPGSGPDSSWR